MIDKKDIKEVISFIFFIFIIVSLLLMTGCTKQNITNTYYQTNYGEECLSKPHTDSYKNLIFCQQQGLINEHIQNELSNN